MLVDRGFQAAARLPFRLNTMDIKDLLGSDPKAQMKPDRPPYVYERAPSPPRQHSIQPAPNFPLHGSTAPHHSHAAHTQALPAPAPPLSSNEHYYRRQSTPYPIKSELSEPPPGWPRYEAPPPPPPHQRYPYQSYPYDHPHAAAYYANYSPNKRSSSFDEQAPKRQKKGKGANQKWDAEEDARIIDLRGSGMKWGEIAKKLPGRTEIACRLHYQNYLEKRGEWDEEKKTKLARVYERMKAEIWQPIASEMGVPWRNAEAMHWTLGERDMARRANTTPFSIVSGANSAGPQGEGNGRIAQANRMHDSTIYFEPGDLEERLRGPEERLSADTNRGYSTDRRASFQSINAPHGNRDYAGPSTVDFSVPTDTFTRSNGSSSNQVSPTTSNPNTLPALNDPTTHGQPLLRSPPHSTSPGEPYRLPPIENLDHPQHPPPHSSYNASSPASSTPTTSHHHHHHHLPQQQVQQQQQQLAGPQPTLSQAHDRPRSDSGSEGSERLLALANLSSQQDRKIPTPPADARSHRSQASNDDGTGSERSYTIIRRKRPRSPELEEENAEGARERGGTL